MKKKNTKNILIINGSIRGTIGNSGKIIKHVNTCIQLEKNVTSSLLTLAEPLANIFSVKARIEEADGFLVISGTYWNSWGSPLQRFIEVMSAFENTPVFFGKPVASVISMDSVGGMEVAGRLHSVFSGFGCWSPPCSTVVISRVGQEAVKSTSGKKNDPNEDVWRLEDLNVVIKNLIRSTHLNGKWDHWPNDELKIKDGPWPDSGILDLGSSKFL